MSKWQNIKTAPKDGTPIWAILRDDIYPTLHPRRGDLATVERRRRSRCCTVGRPLTRPIATKPGRSPYPSHTEAFQTNGSRAGGTSPRHRWG